MSYVHDDIVNLTEARRLLGELWDEAREIAVLKRQLGRGATLPGGVSWLRPENVSGAHLYEEGGGWHCDLTLDDLPEGRPDCIGSPAAMGTREGASTFAVAVLCDVILAHPEPVPPEVPRLPRTLPFPVPRPEAAQPVTGHAFVYDGIGHPIPPRVARELREAGIDKISERYVRRRLEEVRRDLAGNGRMSHEVLAGLTADGRRAFLTVCTMASLKGILSWPERSLDAVAAE